MYLGTLRRCHVDGNIHKTGSLLRFSDGMTIPSIQSSNLTNNVVTSVVRIEGRMWVFNVKFWAGKTQSAEAAAGSNQADTTEVVMQELEDARFSDMVS